MIPAAPNNVTWPVHEADGQYFIEPPNEERAPITLNGQPAQIPEGWRPLFVYAAFSPVYLLELKHDDGQESTWFLDHRFDRIAYDNPESLPKWDMAALRYRAADVLSRVWDQLLGGRRLFLDAEITGFLALNLMVRVRLARLCEPVFDIRTIPVDVANAKERGATVFHTKSGIKLSTEVLLRMLRTDLLTRSLDAIRGGALDWESPVDGAPLTTTGGVWLTDFLFAYRAILIEYDLAFYVLVSGHPCHVVGILFPTERVVFTAGGDYHGYVRSLYKVPIEILLFRHVCQYGDKMLDAWRSAISGYSAVFRERLISGQLWHDLTGLDLLVRKVPVEAIPEIIGLWGGVPEIYGDTEDIFPETRGRIIRSVTSDHAMISHAYDQRRLLVRTQSNYVTKNLYTKLIEVSTNDPSLERSRTLAAGIKRLGCPLVLLGLRVENRTVEDLPEFCAQVIDHLLQRCGKVAIVIDGHNSARGATPVSFASEFQQHAKEEPIVAERRVVEALSERYKGGNVVLIDNIGGSMAQSIFWCHNSNFFVTMYGTGLAKYRWACNQTGLIVTSRWTLHNQGHLHIYEEEYLEDPGPLMFLPEEFVEDLPDSPQLIFEPGNPPARWNFKIQLEGLHAAIDELLRRNYRPPPSP